MRHGNKSVSCSTSIIITWDNNMLCVEILQTNFSIRKLQKINLDTFPSKPRGNFCVGRVHISACPSHTVLR